MQYPVATAHSLPPDVSKIANTDASCAICPCIGCNHKLFCAVGHFSFVLWLLKMGKQKIDPVWKTALLLNTDFLSLGCVPAVQLPPLFLSHFYFQLFNLHFLLESCTNYFQMKNNEEKSKYGHTQHQFDMLCFRRLNQLTQKPNLVSKECVSGLI